MNLMYSSGFIQSLSAYDCHKKASLCHGPNLGYETRTAEFWSLFGPILLTVLPSLPFGMVMSILCHCVGEVWDLLFHFDFIRDCS